MSELYENGNSSAEILRSVSEASDAHEAVGLWWAGAILKANFKNGADGGGETIQKDMGAIATYNSFQRIPEQSKVIARFAEKLAELSREQELEVIGVDYRPEPDSVLFQAADSVGMFVHRVSTFPWNTATSIRDGVVTVVQSDSNKPEQIWPPLLEQ